MKLPYLPALVAALLAASSVIAIRAEDGYRLWLRYDRIADDAQRTAYAAAFGHVVLATPAGADSPTIAAARDELMTGLSGLLGITPVITLDRSAPVPAAGDEGYSLKATDQGDMRGITIAANHDVGVLYGAFALLRGIQTGRPVAGLSGTSAPRISRRILDHWDNLNGTIERGYAGFSLWNWFELPDYVSPRYRDYARAAASIGINGAALTNVNADALVLTEPWLRKVAALAGAFRPYGIRVYLTARFSAPVEIGGLKTADPLDPAVAKWWKDKGDEIYRIIPDFGGFLVKANSEGQPGPQDYGRTHADGANLLADAVAPHDGIVMWRAFVYDQHVPEDRIKQAYNDFHPLDGRFRPNVVIQIKNGPLDFQPREPFHPLFGAMPHTPLAAELQITQEYLGSGIHLAYLAPMWKECLDSDTYASGAGSTVARVVDGSLDHHTLSVIAGVANTGTDRNWCGHPLDAANWYAFGRLAWDHTLGADRIADEWTRMTFGNDPQVVQPVVKMLLASREAVVNYMTPLGLHHLMATDHHYGPGPWVDNLRADWNPVFYHRANADGIGFDRTATGSNAVAQYAPPVAQRFNDLAACPENLLLWFHHVPWDQRLQSGRTLWDELCLHYQHGGDVVHGWQASWASLKGFIDDERFEHVQALLARQERDARWWRDACLLYFQTFSHRPLPAGVGLPERSLADYESIQLHYVPGTPNAK
ncbi:MAG TPA: alpha-glucuronidase family glycosyl hydrolase [Opitutaceae bacterium]|nr:alpha-glucuronidase family glycosyl hydrolase [Opitutaceae bacterium]